ncbi:MAG: chemotaxis protein CheB [Planctomycetes bacterium]|nr:chemotaxis protein CheB [Planctomycetota bacterium]
MRILVAEHSASTRLALQNAFRERGLDVRGVPDGQRALELVASESFDGIATSWLMPGVDGIELIRRLRESAGRELPIVMMSELHSEIALEHALLAGADECVTKPIEPAEFVERVERCVHRATGRAVPASPTSFVAPATDEPDFPLVCVAASTGGPDALARVVESLPEPLGAAVILVQHGPAWMMERFQTRLQRLTGLPVSLAAPGMRVESDHVWVAPGAQHLLVQPDLTFATDVTPSEHMIFPAADPTFRSVATAFGSRSVAVVLTGLGCDGTKGARTIVGVGGSAIVQDPDTAVAPPMPRSVIDAAIPCRVVPLDDIAATIAKAVREKSAVRA